MEGGGGAGDGEDLGVGLGVIGEDRDQDLALAGESGREEGADRAVDEPARQDLVVGDASFALPVTAGEAPGGWPPLDLSVGTAFQREVWQELRRIPRGETRTYGDIAAAMGRPGAASAVGQACGANPVPILVPCHRVLAAQGRLGGFSGGLRWKRLLLERELK